MSPVYHPRVFVVSGPSGVGKSTILAGAMNHLPRLKLSVSATTRPRRPGEVEGEHYFFLTREQFEAMIARGEFLEWARVYDNLYGTSRQHVLDILTSGHHAVLDVDTQGAMNIQRHCRGAVFVFIRPPSLEALRERLRGRGTEDGEALRKRLAHAEHELGFVERYHHVVVNADLDESVQRFVDVVTIEEQRDVPFVAPPAGAGNPRDLDAAELERHLVARLTPRIRQQVLALLHDRVRAAVPRDLEQIVRRELQRLRGDDS